MTMTGRAYSFIQVKAIDEDERVIEGIASTPTPDRVDDIVNPMGAKFKLPLPLLWQHDHSKPIGHVEMAKPSKNGIPFKATIASTSEPGALKERLDEAWQSIKMKLVQAVSIGFRPIKYSFLENGGIEFEEWEWFELSAVTIPANAEATISAIKSMDRKHLKAEADWRVGAARNLSIDDSDEWDGPAAKERMLDAAGFNGDSPDSERARRGFLVYDAGNPDLKGSYKLPIADIRDGELRAVAEGLRAAASRLPQTSIPESVAERAREVLDGYFDRLDDEDGERALKAAPGRQRKSPGASGTPKTPVVKLSRPEEKTMATTIEERIAALENAIKAKSTRLDEIDNLVSDEGRTKAEDEREEYDGLMSEIKALNAELKDQRDREALTVSTAKAIGDPTKLKDASAARGGSTVQVKNEKLEPGIEFTRYAMCLMAAKGDHEKAVRLAKTHYSNHERIIKALEFQANGFGGFEPLMKAAVAAGTTTDATWAGPLVDYQDFAGDFVEYLRPRTIIGQFGMDGIPELRMVPFNIKIKGQTSGGSAYWVGEGKPKPLTKFDFNDTELGWNKVATIAAITEELIRFSSPSAERLVRDGLGGAVIERIDIDFVDPNKAVVANTSPGSITNGVTPIPSSGNDAASIRRDVQALWAPFTAARNPARSAVYIMDSTTARAVSMLQNPLGQSEYPGLTVNGGTFMSTPVIVSDYLPHDSSGGIVILVNASDIWLADDSQVTIDASREASLQMADDPTNDSGVPTAAQLVSMWQTNSVAFRAERYINWSRRRDSAVSYLTGVNWGVDAASG